MNEKNSELSFLCKVQKMIIRNSKIFYDASVFKVSVRFHDIMMGTAWKKQHSFGNCPAKNSEISEFSENFELSPWPSSSLRKKKINRVDNPVSEYCKNLCAILKFISGKARKINQQITPMCNL